MELVPVRRVGPRLRLLRARVRRRAFWRGGRLGSLLRRRLSLHSRRLLAHALRRMLQQDGLELSLRLRELLLLLIELVVGLERSDARRLDTQPRRLNCAMSRVRSCWNSKTGMPVEVDEEPAALAASCSLTCSSAASTAA